jgi:hypothetical protein
MKRKRRKTKRKRKRKIMIKVCGTEPLSTQYHMPTSFQNQL